MVQLSNYFSAWDPVSGKSGSPVQPVKTSVGKEISDKKALKIL
jgi:hypothetical protein